MIVILDYGMGNLHSVLKAFRRIGAKAVVSSKIEDIEKANKLVLPGVGNFKKGMENLKSLGIMQIFNKRIIDERIPILGICLGMQLFTKFSEEGNVPGLGWIDAETTKFGYNNSLRVPHMGWNNVGIKKKSGLFFNVEKNDSFYFVHSFYVKCNNETDILGTTKYGNEFVSSIQKNNIFGTQFHPEKSHDCGLQILRNFVEKI